MKPRSNHNLLIISHLLPPPFAEVTNGNWHEVISPALLHAVYRCAGRAFLCACLLMVAVALHSCEQAPLRYTEIEEYYTESLALPTATADSVGRFSQKVTAFVAAHPAAADDPLYSAINANIRRALLQIATHDPSWGDDINLRFNF